MGASGWHYRQPYKESLAQTLTDLQQQVLAGNDYIWPWEHYDPKYLEGEPRPRPTSLQHLAAAKEDEVFWEEGTHTILDVGRVCDAAEEDDFAAIRPLSREELMTVFGTDQPTGADLDRTDDPSGGGALDDLNGQRWSGRALVGYENGTPSEVVFWGWSGD